MIDPKLLTHLVAIVDEGSLTRASEALNVTQPTLTRSLRILEGQLGAPLVERGRHGARPTELGDRIARYGRVIGEMLERTERDAEAWIDGSVGSLHIGVTPLAATFVSPIIAQFLSDRPNVRIQMTEASVVVLLESLESGALDLLIGSMSVARPPTSMNVRHLFDEELVLVCGAEHPLAHVRAPDKAALQKANWLGHVSEAAIFGITEATLMAAGFDRINVQVRSISNRITVGLLHSGQYVTLVPKHFIADELKAGSIREIDFKFKGIRWPMGLYRREEPMPSAVVEAFSDLLVTHFKDGP